MITKENNIEKLCAIYASDFHLEMMILPYINKKIEQNEDVIIMTDKDITDTVGIILSKLNLKEETKNKILNLDWTNNNSEKFELIKTNIIKNKKLNIFVKGKESYISSINENINQLIKNANVKIINCYELDEIANDTQRITNKYNKILNTLGEENI